MITPAPAPEARPSPDALAWAAARTLAMHRTDGTSGVPGRCAQCGPDGCPLLEQARTYLRSRTTEMAR